MKLEVDHGRCELTREFTLEAVKLIGERGVSVSQATHDLGVHGEAFPGQGHMRPKQGEIDGPAVKSSS